jgi:hypothetical protein
LRLPQARAQPHREASVTLSAEVASVLIGITVSTLGVVIRLMITNERRLTSLEVRMKAHEDLLHPVLPRQRRPA